MDLLNFRIATVDEIIDLREKVIIAGTARDEPWFEGDRDATTRHYGGFTENQCVACMSLLRADHEGAYAYQLRGMAVASDMQGLGIGETMLACVERMIADEFDDLSVLWCNARQNAEGFYTKCGWRTVGDRFEIEGVGEHVKMVRALRED